MRGCLNCDILVWIQWKLLFKECNRIKWSWNGGLLNCHSKIVSLWRGEQSLSWTLEELRTLAIQTLVLHDVLFCLDSMTTLITAVQVVIGGKSRYCWDDGVWLDETWILQLVMLDYGVAELVSCKSKSLALWNPVWSDAWIGEYGYISCWEEWQACTPYRSWSDGWGWWLSQVISA